MSVQTFNARLAQKGDTDENWALVPNFIPLKNEIICYTTSHRFKVGDGVTTISNLPFWSQGGGGSLPFDTIGYGLKVENTTLMVDAVNQVSDNTKPITASAVYTTVGNILAVLEQI